MKPVASAEIRDCKVDGIDEPSDSGLKLASAKARGIKNAFFLAMSLSA